MSLMTSLTNWTTIRKTTSTISNKIRSQAVFSIKDGMDAIRPHYTLDVEKAYDQRLRRIVNRCARRTLDENGKRIAFVLPDQGIIVNINLCNDPALIKAVNTQMEKQLEGFKASVERVQKRIKVLEGQISFEEILANTNK